MNYSKDAAHRAEQLNGGFKAPHDNDFTGGEQSYFVDEQGNITANNEMPYIKRGLVTFITEADPNASPAIAVDTNVVMFKGASPAVNIGINIDLQGSDYGIFNSESRITPFLLVNPKMTVKDSSQFSNTLTIKRASTFGEKGENTIIPSDSTSSASFNDKILDQIPLHILLDGKTSLEFILNLDERVVTTWEVYEFKSTDLAKAYMLENGFMRKG